MAMRPRQRAIPSFPSILRWDGTETGTATPSQPAETDSEWLAAETKLVVERAARLEEVGRAMLAAADELEAAQWAAQIARRALGALVVTIALPTDVGDRFTLVGTRGEVAELSLEDASPIKRAIQSDSAIWSGPEDDPTGPRDLSFAVLPLPMGGATGAMVLTLERKRPDESMMAFARAIASRTARALERIRAK